MQVNSEIFTEVKKFMLRVKVRAAEVGRNGDRFSGALRNDGDFFTSLSNYSRINKLVRKSFNESRDVDSLRVFSMDQDDVESVVEKLNIDAVANVSGSADEVVDGFLGHE